MVAAAITGRAKTNSAGIGFGIGDKLRNRIGWNRGIREFFTSQASKKIATIRLKFKVHWENPSSLGDGNAHDAQVYSSGREEQRSNQRWLTRTHDGIDPEQTQTRGGLLCALGRQARRHDIF